MKSKIKQITLLDGKQLFYPSEEEVRKLGEVIKEIVIEETYDKHEYELYIFYNAMIDHGLDISDELNDAPQYKII